MSHPVTEPAEDLAAWLTAVWDEEEEAMRRVGERIWFVCDDGHVEEPRREDGPPFGSGEYERWDDGEYRLPNHHNTWLPALDPASVLARIAADRKILAQLRLLDSGVLLVGNTEEARREYRSGVLFAVLALASAYEDRPDFPEWSIERQGVEW